MRLPSIVVAGLIATSIGVQSATTNQPQTYRDPFAQMDKIFEMQMRQMEMMKEHMDKLFNNFEQNFKSSTFKTMPIMINSSGIFSSGFKDKKNHYELKIKVHNLKDSKVNITSENGMLTVEIIENKKIERTHGNYGKIISYTNSSSVQSFTLPSDADSTKIEAKQKGSEIIITVPKREKPKSIPIKKEENLSKK
jgi:HSP20 family molecular chaperone IbpA